MDGREQAIDASDWYIEYRNRVQSRLRELVGDGLGGVQDLWRYHMGWSDEQGRPVEAEAGKMLRPVLCMTACHGFGDNPAVIDVAAALELLHAFSLVHDDIEDGDRQRRHRPTLWALAGVPLAVNAGDGLFAKAGEALYHGMRQLDRDAGLAAQRLYLDACLQMIDGQHLDIEFEAHPAVSMEEYVRMVRGKTGAILGAALALGALCGGAESTQIDQLGAAGIELGLAFQATDDALAFWGAPAETGKAVGNDLERGKKSLPVVLAGEAGISMESLRGRQLPDVLRELEQAGTRERAESFASDHAERAREMIEKAGLSSEAIERLLALIDFSIARSR